jgi:hypothetical protein
LHPGWTWDDRDAYRERQLQNMALWQGGILRLHYARTREPGSWLDLITVRDDVVVQFWLRPRKAAVTLEAGEERIPAQLRQFL